MHQTKLEIYPPTKFHNHSFYICTRQNLSMKKKKRAITQRLSKQELRLMCTALPLDEIYPPTKFHNHSNYSFGDMHWTKVMFESQQRAITKKKKKKQTRVMVHVHCTPLDAARPPRVIT